METDAYFADGYYGSAKMLVRALNDGVKGRSVKFSYDPVIQKVWVHMKGDTTFLLYGDLPDILGFGTGDGVVIRTSLDHKTLTQTRFDHVQYIPIMSREFGTIETEIRDDTGRPVPFERGKVMVTLHFRRCSTGLFR